ncbi:electron transport complex protein RnfD [Lachnospiraceae bacterium XBB1006]|nr:electron transport complex protein RnfD [Lachnospiraceae bacterium XBB1006]
MSELFNVSSSPHVRSKDTTQKIMLYVIISLLPAAAFGVYNFGMRALMLILVTISSCVFSEYVFNMITKRKQTIEDLSAVVTGLLLALNLPPAFPWYLAVLGGVFAIIVVKMVFGGLGQNFMNPALGARCFLLISFTGYMTNFTYDGESVATPLALLKAGESVKTMDLFMGTTAGTIGETCVIALLIGALFLILMGVIQITIPASYILTFAVFTLLFGGHGFDLTFLVAELCGGGLMLGAFFMATDYATSPITTNGRIIFGICLGILTGVFRFYGASAEGVSYAIIFSNLLVPLIEKVSRPKAFGKGGKAHE